VVRPRLNQWPDSPLKSKNKANPLKVRLATMNVADGSDLTAIWARTGKRGMISRIVISRMTRALLLPFATKRRSTA